MIRILPLAAAMVLSMLVATPAASQQLQQPTAPAAPVVRGAGMGPALNQPPVQSPPTAIPGNPAQRSGVSSPIRSTGPSKQLPVQAKTKPVETVAPVVRKQVFDSRGRPIPGAIQVSPGRAYDPATGRYYQTVPSGKP